MKANKKIIFQEKNSKQRKRVQSSVIEEDEVEFIPKSSRYSKWNQESIRAQKHMNSNKL